MNAWDGETKQVKQKEESKRESAKGSEKKKKKRERERESEWVCMQEMQGSNLE